MMLSLEHSALAFAVLFTFVHTISIDVRKNEQRFRRVLNDQIAEPHSRPWVVQLKIDGKHLCGAALIMRSPHQFSASQTGKTDVLLTAAHCVLDSKPNGTLPEFSSNPKRIKAHFGKHNSVDYEPWETVIGISHTVINPRFRKYVAGHDIALVKLEKPVEFSDIVQPIALSPFPLNSTSNCSVAGWGRRSKLPDDALLRILDLPNITDYGGVLMEKYSSFEKSTWPGDSGSPVTCYKDGLLYVQGVVSVGYSAFDESLKFLGIEHDNFTSILDNIRWINESLDTIDQMPTIYHSDFSRYIVNVNKSFGSYMLRKKEDHRLDAIYGDEQIISHNRLLELPGSSQIDYLDIWFEDSVHDIVNISNHMPRLQDVSGYTEREGPAQCAAECYLFNGGRPCSYSTQLKRCYFASIDYPRFTNSIKGFNIYFTFADNTVLQKLNMPKMTSSEKKLEFEKVQQMMWDVSLTINPEVEYHCVGTLMSFNGETYTQMNVSKACLIELTRGVNKLDSNAEAQMTAVMADRVHSSSLEFGLADLQSNASYLQMSLDSAIDIPKNFGNEFGRSIDALEMPTMKRYNPFTGSIRRRFLELPYQFQFTMLNGSYCYGTLINETYMSANSPDTRTRFILTTATCAMALRKYNNGQKTTIVSKVGFVLKKIHVHPNFTNSTLSNNIAIVESGDPIYLDKYIAPSRFPNFYRNGFKNLSILVRNNECNDKADSLSAKEIPVVIVNGINDNTINVVTKRILYKPAMSGFRNTEHYNGCPLVELDSLEGTFEMVGMVSEAIEQDNQYIERHILLESFIPWMQSIVAESYVNYDLSNN